MRLLLDTHIWLWAHLEPERLGKAVVRALEDPGNELWLSPISVWEFFLLVERKRLAVRGSARDWLDAAWARVPMHEALLNREVAAHSRSVKVPHEDPADRFIAATAEIQELVLVTDDQYLLRGKGYEKLPNR